MLTATCHTPACGNAEQAITLDFLDPEAPAPDAVLCGVCGQIITDVSEATA